MWAYARWFHFASFSPIALVLPPACENAKRRKPTKVKGCTMQTSNNPDFQAIHSAPSQYNIPPYCDGISAFLSIASSTISYWQRNHCLSQNNIDDLNNQIQTTLFVTGGIFALLGTDNIDCVSQDDSLAQALVMAGDIMREMACIRDSLEIAQRQLNQALSR